MHILHLHCHLWLFHVCFKLYFLPSNSHLRSRTTYLQVFLIHLLYHIKYFHIYIFYFIGHTLSDNGSSTVLQLPEQLFTLTIN